jgi:tetraacyldisaccharide-1-P 4'-kinase
MSKIIKHTYLLEVDHTELDLDLYHELQPSDPEGLQNEREKVYETNGEHSYFWAGDATPIRIELVEDFVNKAREAGANYVEIQHHEDHHGYYLYGLKIELISDQKEVDEIKLQQDREKQAELLRIELMQLDNERARVQHQLESLFEQNNE